MLKAQLALAASVVPHEELAMVKSVVSPERKLAATPEISAAVLLVSSKD